MGLLPAHPLSKVVRQTQAYFNHFRYPLTPTETWFWQSESTFTHSQISQYLKRHPASFSPRLRHQRQIYSKNKLNLASKVISGLSRIPTISAIFITGSLAMNNCPRYDDIDLMIVTNPNTLWLTRFIVILYLKFKHLRRNPNLPEHSSPRVSDKICDNLYLDLNHLAIEPSNHNELFLSHEILQAKCIFDRGGVHQQFLTANSWTKKYLPIAYFESIKKFKNSHIELLNSNFKFQIVNYIFWPLNLLLFIVQYLYMLPHLTSEKISLGYAFFHPRSH